MLSFTDLLNELRLAKRRKKSRLAVPEKEDKDWRATQGAVDSAFFLEEEVKARKAFLQRLIDSCTTTGFRSADIAGLLTHGDAMASQIAGLDSEEEIEKAVEDLAALEVLSVLASLAKTDKGLTQSGYALPQNIQGARALLKFHFALVSVNMRSFDAMAKSLDYAQAVLRRAKVEAPNTEDPQQEKLRSYLSRLKTLYPALFPGMSKNASVGCSDK